MQQEVGAWEFPTKHPMVRNPDGSYSNVRLASFTFSENGKDRTYAIPTMVEGKQLSGSEAVKVARRHGLDKYPSFPDVKSAEDWIGKYHGRILPR